MNNKLFVMALAVAGIVAVSDSYAGGKGVAVCDVGRILKEYPEAQDADDAIKKQKDEYEVEGRKLVADFEKQKDQLMDLKKEADSKALSDEEREKKLQQLDEKQIALRSAERQIRETIELRQKQLQDFGMRANKRVITKVREVISAYAKDKGYDLVIAKGGSIDTVLYSADSIDITEDVLKKFTSAAPAKVSPKKD
jgi:Skp family chaperone for outer membrane proteins